MSDDVSSRLRCLVPPASEPVTLAEAKLFLRVEHDAEDASIARAITAARAACEQYIGQLLLPQQWEYGVALQNGVRVALPVGPATAIDAITIDAVAVAENRYRLSVDGYMIYFDDSLTGVVEVTYYASLVDAAEAVPAMLKQGILHHVAAIFTGREGGQALPMASLASYQPYKRVRL